MSDNQDYGDRSGKNSYENLFPDNFKACEQTGTRNYQGGGADAEKKKRRRRAAGIVVGAVGLLLMIVGMFIIFSAGFPLQKETQEPVDVYLARETDQYVFAPVQYMTEPVAYYEAMEKLQFYIVLDAEWNPALVCLAKEERQLLEDYVEYLYTKGYDNPPQITEVKGYAQPIDSQLRQLVIQGFADAFGEGYVDESNFQEWFGSYYVQTGQKNSAYKTTNAGFAMCLAGIGAVVVCGLLLYQKPLSAAARREYEEGGSLVVVRGSRLLGILGAFLGALLGGFLWTVVMAWGYVSGWLGILIIIFAHTGYVIGSGRDDILGKAFSMLFGVAMVIPATFLAAGWEYYQMVNESVAGYTSFVSALTQLPHFMDSFGLWKDFKANLITGYGYMTIAAVYYIASFLFNHNSARKKNRKTGAGELDLRQINERAKGCMENENEQNLK